MLNRFSRLRRNAQRRVVCDAAPRPAGVRPPLAAPDLKRLIPLPRVLEHPRAENRSRLRFTP